MSYNPSVEAHIATDDKVYDVSDDVTSASVIRKVDAPSSFSITLQNKGWKYNGLFQPMDRATILMSKDGSPIRQITGYVTSADRFDLYGHSLKLSGKCSMYRLQQLYWDPGLVESQMALYTSGFASGQFDAGYGATIMRLLSSVAGMDPSSVLIDSVLPQGVVDWARSLYQAKLEDLQIAKDMSQEFFKVLRESGPQATSGSSDGGGSGTADFSGSTAAEQMWNFGISQGFSKEACAAMIGNAMQESSCNPSCHQLGGPGRGLFQWEIGSDRFAKLCSIASGMGKTWESVEAQLTMFQQEAEGCFKSYTGKTYTYSNGTETWWPAKVSYSEWKTWTDIEKATDCLERVYMRPSQPMRENRRKYARQAYDKYA